MAKRHRSADNPAFDPGIGCRHAPDQTFTKEPCSCGRTFWPPHGRGRGESLLSVRRINAKLRALEVMRLHTLYRLTYAQIARRLGYRTPSGAWRAEQRLLRSVTPSHENRHKTH